MSFTHRARVLIVDDSITMRAFFNSVFEQDKQIDVVGTAASVEEARRLIVERRPNVITLDIEMRGISGLDFLNEIMSDRPTPVIMLSSLTQKDAEASFEALERGAIYCFPKPTSDNREAFAGRLCALVVAAANGSAWAGRYTKDQPARTAAPVQPAPSVPFDWNGKIVTMSASTGGIDALHQLLPAFPADCPPMIITLQIEPEFVAPLLKRLNSRCPAQVIAVEDGRRLERGVIQIATDHGTHAVIDHWPEPSVRLLHSNPVNGVRPSASLLFATAARTAGVNAVGVILTGIGHDGVAGLRALRATGARTISQDSLTCLVDQTPAAARAAGAVELDLPLDQIAEAVLESCRQVVADGGLSAEKLPMRQLSQDDLLALLADELDAARQQLEALGVALIGNDAVARRHITELQSLDHVGQRCASIAAILRAEDRLAAGQGASLESIPARLRAIR